MHDRGRGYRMGMGSVRTRSPSHAHLARLPEICARAVHEGATPGGVLLIGVHDETLTAFPFGNRAVVPQREAATLDTIYDLASLTKPIITATLVMLAVEEGLLSLKEPIGRWLPIPKENPIAEITPYQLLLHTSGLPAVGSVPAAHLSAEALLEVICTDGLAHPPGEVFLYSDRGFHVLAMLIERVFDAPLDELARERVCEPLGMSDTAFGVPPEKLPRCAPTEMVDGDLLRGVVHDPIARKLGGVAGHAGLFGTAEDLAHYCRMLLHKGEYKGARILRPATVERMTSPVKVPGGGVRALGWDVDTRYSNPRGELLSPRGVGHTGFTGTSVWIDPPSGLYIILLTNRVHPDGRGDVVRLRRLVANVAAAAVLS